MTIGLIGVALVVGGGLAARRPVAAAAGTIRALRPLMGTSFEVKIWAPVARHPEAAVAARQALDAAAELERRISEWRDDSETSAVIRAAGGPPVAVSEDLRELVALSIAWSRRTQGAFDVTGGPLFELWEAARRSGHLPQEAEVADARALVDGDGLLLEGSGVRLAQRGMKIGFGAIGKGFAADRLAARLRAQGFPDFIVSAGGDLVIGGSRGRSAWSVGIRHPRRDGLLATWEGTDRAISTSGDYERYFEVDGVRYPHILDLRTGWPVRAVTSATVIAPYGAAADALATALVVLGPAAGLELLKAIPDAEAVLVDAEGRVHASGGLSGPGGPLAWIR